MKTKWQLWKKTEHIAVIFLFLLFTVGAYFWHRFPTLI